MGVFVRTGVITRAGGVAAEDLVTVDALGAGVLVDDADCPVCCGFKGVADADAPAADFWGVEDADLTEGFNVEGLAEIGVRDAAALVGIDVDALVGDGTGGERSVGRGTRAASAGGSGAGGSFGDGGSLSLGEGIEDGSTVGSFSGFSDGGDTVTVVEDASTRFGGHSRFSFISSAAESPV